MKDRVCSPRSRGLILLLLPLLSLWGCSDDLPTEPDLAPTAEGRPGPGIESEHEETAGPEVSGVALDPDPAEAGAEVTLTALATASEGRILAGAEYRIGEGEWSPMEASDGAFDGEAESLTATFTAPEGLAELAVCVRASEPGEEEGVLVTGAEACLGGEEEAVEGFVTGGGWITNVPAEEGEEGDGAGDGTGEETGDDDSEETEEEDTAPDRTHFGFVVRHLPGQETPSGNLNAVIGEARTHFRARAFEFLDIDAEAGSARFGGIGEADGEEYAFEAHVVDGRPDLFHLRIWPAGDPGEGSGEGTGDDAGDDTGEPTGDDPVEPATDDSDEPTGEETDPTGDDTGEESTEAALYDSGEQPLGGGNITLHLQRRGPPPGVGNGQGPPDGRGPGTAGGKRPDIGSQGGRPDNPGQGRGRP